MIRALGDVAMVCLGAALGLVIATELGVRDTESKVARCEYQCGMALRLQDKGWEDAWQASCAGPGVHPMALDGGAL